MSVSSLIDSIEVDNCQNTQDWEILIYCSQSSLGSSGKQI